MKHLRTGFTLVELIVVAATFSIIITAIFAVLSAGRQSWYTGSAQVELQQDTRKAMDWMVRELRQSNSDHVTIGGGGTTISLQVPINDNPDWGAQGSLDWSIQYSLNNAQILREVFDENGIEQVNLERVLANNIRSNSPPPNALMFIGTPALAPTVVDIEITAEKDILQGRTMQSTLNSQVSLRN